jgi:uncharacterized membrane protein
LTVARVLGIDTWLAILWIINIASFVPRQQLLLDYKTLAGMTPWLEPLTVPPGWLFVLVVLAGTWWWHMLARGDAGDTNRIRCLLGLSLLPLLANFLRAAWPEIMPAASIFEPLWAAALSGAVLYVSWPDAADSASNQEPIDTRAHSNPSRLSAFLAQHATLINHLTVGLSCIAAAGWWWYQSHDFYSHFMLGFNDFGHFAQRIASTAEGRGFLLESPVLPAFWDHFNPGLALLVPVWKLWPSVEMIFLLHAVCLAGSGWLVARLALALGAPRHVATLWCLAWLLHPSVSQMNLAYTYGWHPVCLAIPGLLYAILKTIRRQHVAACMATIVACSMEETVLVIVAAYCVARAAGLWFYQRRDRTEVEGAGDFETQLASGWKAGVWLSAGMVVALLFVVVYRWSGLAQFQTARFVALGDNTWAILASPVLRPAEFWGQLLSYRNMAFIACLAIPLFPLAVRSTWSIWIATMVPLGVLMVWDHNPAKSLAFHYPATILPIWLVAAVAGAMRWRGGRKCTAIAAAALVTGLLLSKYLGQLPWTGPMLNDVIWSTYPTAGLDHRAPHSRAGRWLTEQVDTLRQRGEPVLATGRAAAHLIGCDEVETVGQFFERRERLQALTPDSSPLLRYGYMILDRTELFQQSAEDFERLETEAKSLGFRVIGDRHDIVVLEQ